MIAHAGRIITLLITQAIAVELMGQQAIFQSKEASAQDTCRCLATYYPGYTLFSSDPEYSTHQSEYWAAQQSDLKPACRFLAPNARAVKHAVEQIYLFNTSFAVVSGGHTSNTGFSNIGGGITIDLGLLNKTRLSDDHQSVWIGPGARWRDVYRALESQDVTVAGARIANVGVGGFVLGGGISWYANQVGFSCDALIAFEIVTPTLQVLIVDRDHYSELFWALKGSAGSFGVVTAIKMRTVKVSSTAPIYAGAIAFEESQLSYALSILAKTSTDTAHDAYTSSYLSFGYLPATQELVYNVYVANTQGSNDTLHINDWRTVSSIYSGLRHTTILDSAEEISTSNPLGMRRSKFTFTTSPQLEKVTPLHTLFRNFASSINLDRDGLLGMNFQPITALAMGATIKSKSPNIFSETLVQDMVPYLIVSVELWWSDSDRDAELEGLMKALYEQMIGPDGVGWAKHVWLYPNYAAAWQEVLAEKRLGKQTVDQLRYIRRIYDPQGTFQRLRVGVWDI